MAAANCVLVVDDQPSNLHTLEALLTPLNLNLVFAASGPEALRQAAALRPDLILLDVMMPAMDGFEVCRRLRANPLLAEVPVIMVTALDDRESLLQGIEAGADDFVTKPFDRVVLRARVHTILRLNRYRRLLTERQRFAWVVEQAEEGYLIADEDGAGAITYANPQARRWLGLEPGGTGPFHGTLRERVESRYRSVPEAAWQQAALPGHLVRPETETEGAFWLEVRACRMPGNDVAGTVVRLRNVTRQMELQREAWSFNTLVTHKLRTPVAGVVGGLELIAKLANELPPDELATLAELAYRDAERLQATVEDVVHYVNARRLTRQQAPFSLSQLGEVVLEIAQRQDVSVAAVNVAPGLEAVSVWPAQQLVQLILAEVLENAKKFHPRRRPTVRVNASLAQAEHRALLSITDDGRTLAEDTLSRIWIPYYQVEKSLTGEVAGMGLGLAVVANLVWSVGGECRARNQPNGPGLVIELLLPVSDGQPPLAFDADLDALPLPVGVNAA